MALIPVNFEYLTGLRRPLLANARLTGNWDSPGPQVRAVDRGADDGFHRGGRLSGFRATVNLDDSQIGQDFRWGVFVDTPATSATSGVSPPRLMTRHPAERYRTFTLRRTGQTERYYLTHCRRLGANKLLSTGGNPGDPFCGVGAKGPQCGTGPRRGQAAAR